MTHKPFVAALLLACLVASAAMAEEESKDVYKNNCASCHGKDLTGAGGPSLIDKTWLHGNSADEISSLIKKGSDDDAMPAFGKVLSDKDIRGLVIYMQEQAAKAGNEKQIADKAPKGGVFTSMHHKFRLSKIAATSDEFWSVNFLSNGDMITTRQDGKLYVGKGRDLKEIEGIPEVFTKGQGGLLSVAPHPEHASNGWIYLSYSDNTHKVNFKNTSMTKVIRGKIKEGKWVESQTLFQAKPQHNTSKSGHFGSRFVFDAGFLYFTVGDRFAQDQAQDLSRPNGKIHRIHDDGRIPDDNPFVGDKEAVGSIWSYGHRNPQGLAMHPQSGLLFNTEHGPRGGDEVNHIKKGANYGWPIITYGMNYNGTPITELTSAPGLEQPLHYWTPSIAVGATNFYTGKVFSGWKNDMFIASLSKQELWRFRLDGTRIVEKELLLKNQGRIRDVITGPDGSLYLSLDGDAPGIYELAQAD